MNCPAVEHGKVVKQSNEDRLLELAEEFRAAGMAAQINEFIAISYLPEASFTARAEKKRAERISFTG